MNDAMDAEFGTVAAWTADVALDLGPEFRVPAGCRGSGSPPALDWLLDRLTPAPDSRMLDVGAGVGGPAAYASGRHGVVPVLTDPEAGAVRAARRVFGLPAVQAQGTLPFRDNAFDLAWSLGVLCTVPHDGQQHFVDELRRTVRPGGRVGLLVFVRTVRELSEQPQGNAFPTEDELLALVSRAGFGVAELRDDDVGAVPSSWTARVDAVEAELARRHGGDPAWETATAQAAVMGRLLEGDEVSGRLLVLDA